MFQTMVSAILAEVRLPANASFPQKTVHLEYLLEKE